MESQESSTGWKEFVSGNHTYFEEVVKEFYPNLYRYGLKLCQRPEFVKDNIQELFEIIWQNRNKLSHVESPFYYLSVSLRRQIFKKLGRQKEKRQKLEEYVEGQEFIEFGVEEAIIRGESVKEQREKLIKALNQLPVKQKEVIYLRFYQGLSYREIAKILSLKRQSVRNHVYRSMEIMRTLLGKETIHIDHHLNHQEPIGTKAFFIH